MPVPCRVLLVGMMGSGKSAMGAALARRTGWAHHDNDALLEAATGRTAREIAADGEPALREAESAALQRGIALPQPAVVSVAAGAVLDDAVRRRLAGAGIVVWLRADPSVLADRVRHAEHRPWLEDDASAWLAATAALREPMYRELANLVVDTDSEAPDILADRLVAELAAGPCARWLARRVGGSSGVDP